MVVVRPGTTPDGIAAVEQAVRFAERLEQPLVLVTGDGRRELRRATTLERRLTAAGVDLTRSTEEQLALEVASGQRLVRFQGSADRDSMMAPPAADVLLVVRGRADDNAERLDSMLARRTPEPVR